MKLLFIDESGDKKFHDYLGICIAIIDAAHYAPLKRGFQDILRNSKWDESIEFKGAHIFSASKGDTSVDVGTRVEIAEKLLELNVAKMNARMTFTYGSQRSVRNIAEAYLQSIPVLISKALPRLPKGGQGKTLLAVTCDYRCDINVDDLQTIILPTVRNIGWELFESVTMQKSTFHTVGILYADLVGYLAARVDTISNDAELFDGLSDAEIREKGRFKKLESSTRLLSKIKEMRLYKKVAI